MHNFILWENGIRLWAWDSGFDIFLFVFGVAIIAWTYYMESRQ